MALMLKTKSIFDNKNAIVDFINLLIFDSDIEYRIKQDDIISVDTSTDHVNVVFKYKENDGEEIQYNRTFHKTEFYDVMLQMHYHQLGNLRFKIDDGIF